MAKKASQEPVQTLIETFNDFNEMKHIDKTTLLGVLEESFRSVIAKLFGSDENYTVPTRATSKSRAAERWWQMKTS